VSEHDRHPPTAEHLDAWRAGLRWPGDGLDGGFARPDALEPLASRIERAHRVYECRAMTDNMLTSWRNEGAALLICDGVWVAGVCVDFLVFTWKGVFCVWTVDYRWTVHQAALVQPARARIQEELAGWPGKVEAVFHSPREPTGSSRHVLIHPDTDEPVEIVIMTGRIDEVLFHWHPVGGAGLDPEWINWLIGAAEPRWWHADAGRLQAPQMPPEERL
jgi:hypothetical protein